MAILNIKPAKKDADLAGTQIEVLVEASDINDFGTIETRQKVLTFARHIGFNASGLSTVPQPYPVDEDGNPDPAMLTDPKNHPFHHWQAAYQVNAGLR